MSFKRPYMHSHHSNTQDKPWLRYPDPDKPSNAHSRSLSPLPPQKHLSPGLKHKRSSSKINGSSTASSSNASLPMSLASNSSSDSLGHPHTLLPRPTLLSNKPKNLSDELSFALHNNDSNINSRTGYPSLISPSDLLGIPDPNTSASSSAPSSLAPQNPQADQKSESQGKKARPSSSLSINTSFGNTNVDGVSSGPGTPPLPRLSHSSSHSSSASSSSYSNSSSPTSTTAPCSVLCPQTKNPGHHSHSHSHSHSSHNHHHHHQHHHQCQHKQERHRHHHPSCHHRGSSPRHGTRSVKPSKGSNRAPQYVPDHEDELNALSNTDGVLADDPIPSEEPLEIPEESSSTAVTIVGSTPSFGIDSFRKEGNENDITALSTYEAEPPMKRQRSTAAVILGAAVETVIFTSAVALSAYQLLTGKGKQQLEAAMAHGAATMDGAEFESKDKLADGTLMTKTVPVNIPIPTRHKHSGHQLGKSLHHHHKSKHSKLSRSRHGLSISLPHAYGNGDHMGDLDLPERPNTGTEDSDEQFLRMEAQISSLITEGKRALNSRIPDLA